MKRCNIPRIGSGLTSFPMVDPVHRFQDAKMAMEKVRTNSARRPGEAPKEDKGVGGEGGDRTNGEWGAEIRIRIERATNWVGGCRGTNPTTGKLVMVEGAGATFGRRLWTAGFRFTILWPNSRS